jgi:circadian clock protein KaiC
MQASWIKDLKTVSSKARENLTWEKENLDHQMVALASPIILGTLSRFTDKVSSEKVETGIEGLDLMLEGGVFKGSTTKVVGPSGTGKTTLGLHFLYEGAKRKEKGLYVSFEEPVEQLIRHGEGFGWHLRQLAEEGTIKFVSYYPEPYSVEELLLQITNLIKEQKPSRSVIDSITKLERIFSENECMNFLLGLQSYARNEEITTILISAEEEASSAARFMISTLMDNIISLRHVEVESTLKRSLVIFKARGTAHDRDIREFEITPKGMIVKERFVGLEQVLGGKGSAVEISSMLAPFCLRFGGLEILAVLDFSYPSL